MLIAVGIIMLIASMIDMVINGFSNMNMLMIASGLFFCAAHFMRIKLVSRKLSILITCICVVGLVFGLSWYFCPTKERKANDTIVSAERSSSPEKLAKVEKQLMDMLTASPDNADVLYGIGRLKELQNNINDADVYYMKAYGLNPLNRDYQDSYFRILMSKDKDRYISTLYEAKTLNPDDPHIDEALADVFMIKLDFFHACHYYELAAKKDNKGFEIQFKLALAYYKFSRNDLAHEALLQARNLAKTNEELAKTVLLDKLQSAYVEKTAEQK